MADKCSILSDSDYQEFRHHLGQKIAEEKLNYSRWKPQDIEPFGWAAIVIDSDSAIAVMNRHGLIFEHRELGHILRIDVAPHRSLNAAVTVASRVSDFLATYSIASRVVAIRNSGGTDEGARALSVLRREDAI